MNTPSDYRVISKRKVLALAVPFNAGVGLVLWVGLTVMEYYTAKFFGFEASPAEETIATLASHLKLIVAGHLIFLIAFSAYLIWYGRKAIRTQSMPPIGSWVIEGQRIRRGSDAIRAARVMIVLAGALVIIGAIGSMYLWQLSGQLSSRPI